MQPSQTPRAIPLLASLEPPLSINDLLRDLDLSPALTPSRPATVPPPSRDAFLVEQAVDDALVEVAMHVHDNELQVLGAITTGLHNLADQLQEPTARERADELATLLARTIADLRCDLLGLSLAARLPLGRRLADTLDDLRLPGGPDLLLRLSGRVDSLADVSLQDEIVAVIREANSNAIRHAQATTVLSFVQVDSVSVRISVADDGAGLTTDLRGTGLRTMDRQARVRAGEFTVSRRPYGGTRLEWVVPVRRAFDVCPPTGEQQDP